MPHITAKFWPGRSEALKEELANELTATMERVLGSNPDSISITIEEVEEVSWPKEVYKKEIIDKKDQVYKMPGYTYDPELYED